jgi:LuxR family maltose regulon positive regulatory protein
MTASLLLRTKFIVPSPKEDHLPRPQLTTWMADQVDKRLILISAPPGYGKTTLLADFLSATTLPYAWYQLDAGDSDPTVFLTGIIEAIRRMTPAPEPLPATLGQAAQSLLENPEPVISHQRVLNVLINELTEAYTAPWLIVLEDYHYITGPAIHALIDSLLENSPPGMAVVISSRAEPPLKLARLRARGLLAELRANDLRFRDDEVLAYITHQGAPISPESLNLLIEKTEGWAAVLQIVRSSLAGHDMEFARQVITGLSGSHRFVFDYLADEVFRRQPETWQEFLLHTAVLSQMDSATCGAVANVPNAQEILEEIEKQNLFLTSIDPQRRWFRYHTLFREFLLSKLHREKPDAFKAIEKIAGQYYETLSEWEAAFLHYANAGAYPDAARVMLSFAADYVERGRVEVLHRYISMLPAEVLHAHPELLLHHGNAHRRLGMAGLALSAYEDARAAFTSQGNLSGISRALTRLAEVNRAQGNYRQAELLATQALESAPANDHPARADALMALAKSTGFLTGMDQGRSLAEQAVEETRLAGEGVSPLARAGFLQSLGQICWWHGDPQAAVNYCQEALHLVHDDLSPIAAQIYILLVTPHLYWREFETALRYAERGLEISQTLHLAELLPAAYTALGNVLTRLGETARAETALRQSVELAQRLGIAAHEQLMATSYLTFNLSSQGRVEEAWQLIEGALWAFTGSPDTYEAFQCQSVMADVALEKYQLSRAENLFDALLQTGERRQFNIPLGMVHFGLAYIHLATGRAESGLAHARAALALLERTRAIQLFLDQGERTKVVCNALAAAGEDSPFLQRVRELLPGKRQKLAAVAVTQSTIVVRCLGNLRVLVNGVDIPQERWVSTKARDLLAYFVTFRGDRIPAERIFDGVWVEKPGRGLTAFHTALSRMRSALKTGDSTLRFVFVEAGEYWLDQPRFSIDVEEFDAALAKAHAASADDTAAHWYDHAINLYQGEYLQNLYYDWLLPERRRLSRAYLESLRALADHHFIHGRYTHSLELLQRALRVDNLIEDLHCQAMRVYAALGDRAGLARQYQELKELLANEIGMEPLTATNNLYNRLLDGLKN